MRRLLTLSFALLMTVITAHAVEPICNEYRYADGPWKPTKQQACDAFAAMKLSRINAQPGHSWSMQGSPSLSGNMCGFTAVLNVAVGALNPGQLSYEQGALETKTVVCEEVCKRIEGKKTNITIGYHATPSDNLKLNPATKYDPFFKQLMTEGGGTTCIAGCEHFMYKPGADTKTWVSQVAGTNGLYRSSADVSSTQFATPCGGAPAEGASPSAPIPECNGALGDVNGATVCLPRNTDTGVDLGGLPDATRGNPPAGEVPPGKDDKERAPGPGGAGNGSGTGGASNGGGASGGPATGSNNKPGGKGCNDGSKSPELPCSGKGELDADGTTDKPGEDKEQQACGAPGQPKCRIDETGTPDGKNALDKSGSDIDQGKDSWISEIAKWQEKTWDDFTWTFQLPSGCTPLSLEGFEMTLDVCQFQPMIHDIMSVLWAAAAVFGCMTLVFRTNAGG